MRAGGVHGAQGVGCTMDRDKGDTASPPKFIVSAAGGSRQVSLGKAIQPVARPRHIGEDGHKALFAFGTYERTSQIAAARPNVIGSTDASASQIVKPPAWPRIRG
jgi:hypothetical protein